MSVLSADCRQLIVEAALAGVNHSLLAEARDILKALPLLISDPQVRLLCEAMLLFGLHDQAQALALLATSGAEEAQTMRSLLLQGMGFENLSVLNKK